MSADGSNDGEDSELRVEGMNTARRLGQEVTQDSLDDSEAGITIDNHVVSDYEFAKEFRRTTDLD